MAGIFLSHSSKLRIPTRGLAAILINEHRAFLET